jgi:C_GCAxxG_C_C family probable redox protein
MKEANEFFMQGYSCSEAIVKYAIAKGLVKEELLPVASCFSGGMKSGCLCGAIAGTQLVIGSLYGRNDKDKDGMKARQLAARVVSLFKDRHKVTCCKILTKDFEMHSVERKQHCVEMVNTCVEILTNILEEEEIKSV